MFILCSNTNRSRRHHILLPLDVQGQDLYQRSLILTTICPFSGADGDDPALPGRTLESHRHPRQNNHPEAYVVAFFAVQQRTLLIACGVRALAGILGSVAVSMMSAAYGRQMPANGGQIDNLEAFQRQIFGMCRSGCAQNPPRRAVRSHHHRDWVRPHSSPLSAASPWSAARPSIAHGPPARCRREAQGVRTRLSFANLSCRWPILTTDCFAGRAEMQPGV